VIRYNIGADSDHAMKPYVIFGAGFYQSNKTDGSTRVTGTLSSFGPIDTTSPTTQDSEQNALVSIGIGAQTHFSETLLLITEVRYQKIVFKKGSRGAAVGTIQTFMNAYFKKTLKIDNDFGKTLEADVKKFQTQNKITATGQVATKTIQAMINWTEKNTN
jgi:hypothetical protein